jgi:hypothetical protein
VNDEPTAGDSTAPNGTDTNATGTNGSSINGSGNSETSDPNGSADSNDDASTMSGDAPEPVVHGNGDDGSVADDASNSTVEDAPGDGDDQASGDDAETAPEDDGTRGLDDAGGASTIDADGTATSLEAGTDGDPRQETAGGCAAGDYIICEDFEQTEVGDIPVDWTVHGEPIGVTDSQAHHGLRALELGERVNWERRIYHDASALGGDHWGRIYYKVQQPVPDAFVHSTLVALHGVGPTTGAGEFRVIDTVKQAVDTPDVASLHQFLYNVQPEDGAEFGHGGPYSRPFDDQWHCAEYHIDDTNQSYTLWVDGEEEVSFENGAGNFDDSDMPSSYDDVRVGWINYQDAPPGFVAWIDDVVFDDQAIGCEAAE